MRLVLPAEFLPCIDDPVRLRIMADYILDSTDGWKAPDCPLDDAEREFLHRLLLWTADEWQSGLYCRREDLLIDGQYRLRWKVGGTVVEPDRGYSRVQLCSRYFYSTPQIRAFRVRRGYQWNPEQFTVAWWDLTPYRKGEKKPKRRNGFATQTNAILAIALANPTTPLGGPLVSPILYQPHGEAAEEPRPGGLFSC